jgi:hypothetical protein
MNSTLHNRATTLLTTTVLLFGALNAVVSPASAANAWQEKQLYQPSEQQLAREESGAVTILSGFTDREVVAALDQQFDRVEHMMFINTVVTDHSGEAKQDEDTGKPVVEDDGC